MLVSLHHACSYTTDSNYNHQNQINTVFANFSKEDVIYPLTVKKITHAQKDNAILKKLSKTEKYSTQLVEDTQILCKDGKMVIPTVLQNHAVSWYHHYLQHPGHTHLEETLHTVMYWNGMRHTIQSLSKSVVHIKLTNDTSTRMGNSLLSLSSHTLGRHCV
jgi:hypothetical protein